MSPYTINGLDAMKKEVQGMRELTVKSRQAENGQLLISISDTGVALPPDKADQISNAFLYHETTWDRYGNVHQPLPR